MYFALIGL